MKEIKRISNLARKNGLLGIVLIVVCALPLAGAILKFFYYLPEDDFIANFLKNIIANSYQNFEIVRWLWPLAPTPTIEPLISLSNVVTVLLILGLLGGVSLLLSSSYHSNQLALARQTAKEHKMQQEYLEQYQGINPVSQKQSRSKYDTFICHASDDKDDFVRPLAKALETKGFKVWFDEFTLEIGDSLRHEIDRGLGESRFGIVVFSRAFFNKKWPQYELNGLVAREMEGKKLILPIWHRVSKDEVRTYSPSLSEKLAINSSLSSMHEIVEQLSKVLKK